MKKPTGSDTRKANAFRTALSKVIRPPPAAPTTPVRFNQVAATADVDGGSDIIALHEVEKFILRQVCNEKSYKKKLMRLAYLCANARLRLKDLRAVEPSVTAYMWTRARRYFKYPGPGNDWPEQTAGRRMQVSYNKIKHFIDVLADPTYIQRVAHGCKSLTLTTGQKLVVDKINRNESAAQMYKRYISSLPSFNSPLSHDLRCKKRNKEGLRCLRAAGHEEKHSFTPKGEISLSTAKRIIKKMTSGQVKSLAGIDGAVVALGEENFDNIKKLATRMLPQLSPMIHKRVDEIERYLKIAFADNLSNGSNCVDWNVIWTLKRNDISSQHSSASRKRKRPSQRQQQTASSSAQDNDIPKKRDKHVLAMETIFIFLFNALDTTRMATTDSAIQRHNENVRALQGCITSFFQYMGHIVRGRLQTNAIKDAVNNLKPGHAFLMIDWKMKIIPMLHREPQKDWYAKRGSAALLGIVVITCPENEEEYDAGDRVLEFYNFLTDDTKQDWYNSLCGLSAVADIMHETGITSYDLAMDGAGCFVSREMKCALSHLATAPCSLRHVILPEPGFFKSRLDSYFSQVSRKFRTEIDATKGGKAVSADDFAKLLIKDGGLKSSRVFRMSADRCAQPEVSTDSVMQENRIWMDVRFDASGNCVFQELTSYGKTMVRSLEQLQNRFQDSFSGPKYTIAEYEFDQHEDTSILKQVPFLQRDREQKESTALRASNKAAAREVDIAAEVESKGIYRCGARNELGERCAFEYTYTARLEQHLSSGRHRFLSMRTPDRISHDIASQHQIMNLVAYGGGKRNAAPTITVPPEKLPPRGRYCRRVEGIARSNARIKAMHWYHLQKGQRTKY